MRYVVECELSRFQAWSSGKTWLEELIDHPKAYDYIVDLIEEADLYGEGEIRTEVEINDYLWFYMKYDLEEAGFLNEDHEWIEDDDEEEEDEND